MLILRYSTGKLAPSLHMKGQTKVQLEAYRAVADVEEHLLCLLWPVDDVRKAGSLL